MLWIRTWILGAKSVLLHPMRSVLTVMGIFIGVVSVIWLLAIGEGISQEAQKQIEGLGADNIIVRSIKPLNPPENSSSNFILPYGLLRDDYDKLQLTLGDYLNGALKIREMRREVRYRDRTIEGRVVGCEPAYAEVTRLEVDEGRFLEELDNRECKNVCVLAAKVVDRLFPYENPIGRRIYLQEQQDYYHVIGTVKHREATAAIGGSLAAQEFSNDVYIPIETVRKRIGDTIIMRSGGSREGETVELNQITLRINDTQNVMRASELVKDTLNDTHGKVQDVSVVVPKELLDQAANTKTMFMVFMGFIAGISLLVGGIGIMNIMLATVTERTREIGIRRALGAKRWDIIRQFLVETMVLSVVGGLTGILAGYLCGPFIAGGKLAAEYFNPDLIAGLPEVIRNVHPTPVPASIPLAFFISVAIGVVFGIYPAIRAAQMDPIEALRHE